MFTTGHQANLGALGTILGPGDTVIADSGDHASILDGCILSRAKLRPFRHNRLDRLEHALERATGDGGGILVVVDGVFSMEGDVAPLPEIAELCSRYGARLMVDEAHALGVLGARGAGTSELFGVEDRGRPADGDVLQVAGVLRRGDRRAGGRDRVPADPVAPVHVHRGGGSGGGRRHPGRGPDLPLRGGARSCSPGCSTTPATCTPGLSELGFQVVKPTRLADGTEVVTTVVPVVVGDDWKAAFLWKALYEAGVFVNMALHPAVPPAGALLRTSVMATHDRADARPSAGHLRRGQAQLRGRARAAPDRLTGVAPSRAPRPGLVQSRTRRRATEKRRSKRSNAEM